MKNYGNDVKVLWQDKKRHFGLPLSFTTYAVIEKPGHWAKLIIEKGFLTTHVEEIHLYRVDDIATYQGLGGKLFGTGNVTVYVKDATCNNVILINVQNPYEVRTMLNNIVERERSNKKMGYFEGGSHYHGMN